MQPPPLLLGQIFALGEDFFDSADAQPRLLKSLFAALAALRGARRFVTEQLIVAFFELGALVTNSDSCFVLLLLVIYGIFAILRLASVLPVDFGDEQFGERVLIELFVQ